MQRGWAIVALPLWFRSDALEQGRKQSACQRSCRQGSLRNGSSQLHQPNTVFRLPAFILAMSTSTELLWALIGLLLTIGGTFLPASVAMPVWNGSSHSLNTHSLPLGVTYQIGAVLLIGCLGGKNAAALSQIAYLMLGLTTLPIFHQGGGLGYVREPTFGYLLGFIPGAWVCGYLAFKALPRLETLMISCFCGLISIHLIGIAYLTLTAATGWINRVGFTLAGAIAQYSFAPLPGQLAVMCAVTLIAFTMRQLMFY
jgi:biotin transport system substrate-specific component